MLKTTIEQQNTGGKHDSSVSVQFDTAKECLVAFRKIEFAFININYWDHIFKNTSSFHVPDSAKIEKVTRAQPGDLVKIKIPGPKNKLGHGYDWVKIVSLEKSWENEVQTLCLVLSPTSAGCHLKKTAHFFTSKSKNYFIIRKSLLQITAEVHGRNEVPNLKHQSFRDQWRNLLIAKGGILGFSKINWETWCENILDEKIVDHIMTKNNRSFLQR